MAFATRTFDFANVDALLKAAELLEGTLNTGFSRGIEKADSDIKLPMDIYAHSHDPTVTNTHSANGQPECLSKLVQKNHSLTAHSPHQDILRIKADKLNTPSKFWTKKSSTAMEQLGRTLSASGYQFVKTDTELPLHGINGPWIGQTPRVDRSRSSTFGKPNSPNHSRIFTAASGFSHDLRPPENSQNPIEDDPEGSSNTSEVEDSCLDNSSQDSFTCHQGLHGLQQNGGIRRFIESSSFNCERSQSSSISVSSPTSSHCRLRTALLNSPGQLNSVSNKGSSITSSRPCTMQPFPVNGRTARSPSELNRSLVISRRTERNTKSRITKDAVSTTSNPPMTGSIPSWSSVNNLRDLPDVHRSSSSNTSSTGDAVCTNSLLPMNRPPSAAPALLRMSSDSCVERTFASQKSASQPHSPDYQSRHASMPMSPCRLPMKKRKFDWNRVTSEGLSKRVVSSPYSMSEQVSFSPNGTNPVSMTMTSTSENLIPNGGLTVSTPLVVDCPLDRIVSPLEGYSLSIKKPVVSLSAPPSVFPFTRDNTNITDDEDTVDRRPRSIPSSLNDCFIPNPVERVATGAFQAAHSSTNNLLTESALQSTLNNLAAVLSSPSSENSQNRLDAGSNPLGSTKTLDYSQLSSLIRTLTASGLVSSPSGSVQTGAPPEQVSTSLVTESCNKLECEPVAVTRESEIRSNPVNPVSVTTGGELLESDLAQSEPIGMVGTRSFMHSRFNPSRLNGSNRCCVGSELDSNFNSSRSNGSHRSIQTSECLSSFMNKTAPRQSFKLKKWLSTTEPSSRCLVTDSFTVTPSSSSVTTADGLPLTFQTNRISQATTELTTSSTAFHRSLSEPLNQPTPSAKHPLAFEAASSSPAKESRLAPPSKLIIDSIPASQNGDTTWSCQPPPPNNNFAPYSADPGAQILMMLSPSEQDKSVSSALDPSLAQVLQTSYGGKSSKKFPLLLVSASSSASAAALAAAAAMATGAPPTSLVPVPVQVRTYFSTEGTGTVGEQSVNSSQSARLGAKHERTEDGFSSSTHQRLILSFCPPDNGVTTASLDKKLPLVLSTSPLPIPNTSNIQNNLEQAKVESNVLLPPDATRLSLFQPTAVAHSN